jgi:hypothetical protein
MKQLSILWIVLLIVISIISFIFMFPCFYILFPTIIIFKVGTKVSKDRVLVSIIGYFWLAQSMLDVALYYIKDISWLYVHLLITK